MSMNRIRWAFNSKNWQPSQSEWTLCAQCVQQEEKERIGKFVFKKDSKSAMIGRVLMRKGISESLGIPFHEVQMARTEKGKPYLLNTVPEQNKNFSFNISHQGDYVVIATDPCKKVGIDVMKLDTPRAKPVPDFFNTMKRQFTSSEWGTIKSDPREREQLKTFYRLWCLKESYVKALGVGIGFEVQRLDFQLSSLLKTDSVTMDTIVKVDGEVEEDWTFEESLLNDHCVAVAVKHEGEIDSGVQTELVSSKCFKHLTIQELLDTAQPLSAPDQGYWELFYNKPEDPTEMKKAK